MEIDCMSGVGEVVEITDLAVGDQIVGETGEIVEVRGLDGRTVLISDMGEPDEIDVPEGVKVRRVLAA